MYQNILQQLQQLFSGGGSVGMQPGGAMPRGPGGISDMMYRYPPGTRPSFIDGLMQPPAVAGLQPPTIGGELPPVTGGGAERPGTYGVTAPGAPDPRGNGLPGYGGGGQMPPSMGGPLPPFNGGSVGGGNTAAGTPMNPGSNWPLGGNPAPGGERPGTYGIPAPGTGARTNYPGIERPSMPRNPTGPMNPPRMGTPKPMPMPGANSPFNRPIGGGR